MKINVYFTLEQYKDWQQGKEVRVNNLERELGGNHASPPGVTVEEVKISASLSEEEVLHIESSGLYKQDFKEKISYYTYTVKKST